MSVLSPKDYERLVKTLMTTTFEAIDAQAFHLKKYLGKSGQHYEIDVSFEARIGVLELLVLVECKRYKRPVTVQEVADFAYRIQDTGAHKGVLVSPHGFQRGALQVAKAEKIALLVVSDEIEFKPQEIEVILRLTQFMEPRECTAWFSGLRVSAPSQDGEVALQQRWFIPRDSEHHIVDFGESDIALRQTKLRGLLREHNAYLRPCFRLCEEEDEEGPASSS